MNRYPITESEQSNSNRDGKSSRLRLLMRTIRRPWILILSLVALFGLLTATFAQRNPSDQRAPKPPNTKVEQPVTQAGAPIVLGTSTQTVQIPGNLTVGNGRLQVVNSAIGGGVVASNLYIRQLNQSGALPHVCWKPAPDGVQALLLTTCTTSQSALRYKTDLQPFLRGLDLINRLTPYNFAWKQGGMREIGLVAEDVAKVEPLLTFNNEKGELEGVKYENLNVVFINAIKEQQAQIDELRQLIKTQQELLKQQSQQIEALKKPVSP